MTEKNRVNALLAHQIRKEIKGGLEASESPLPPVETINQKLAAQQIASVLGLPRKTFSMPAELSNADRAQNFAGQSRAQIMGKSTAAERQENSILQKEYYRAVSELARAEIEQDAGKALLTQANQRPAIIKPFLH